MKAKLLEFPAQQKLMIEQVEELLEMVKAGKVAALQYCAVPPPSEENDTIWTACSNFGPWRRQDLLYGIEIQRHKILLEGIDNADSTEEVG